MTKAEWKEQISSAISRGGARVAASGSKVDPKLDQRVRTLARQARALLATLADDNLGAIDRAAALVEITDIRVEMEFLRKKLG